MPDNLPTTTLVIFGVSGHLSQHKLLPALAEICTTTNLKSKLKILGSSRHQITSELILKGNASSLSDIFNVIQLDYDRPEDYQKLKQELQALNSEQIIFYFAVPPEAVLPIITNLGNAGLNSQNCKLLLEKPFGRDLQSAQALIEQTNRFFAEEQVYRIDHYLAKEMSQNIAVFLGGNALFRDVWNNKFIERIEVLGTESVGIEGRAEFYEQTGALRDFVQSHLLQLAALTLMEPCPNLFDFSQIHSRRLAALGQFKLAQKDNAVIRGQYDSYKSEVSNPNTSVETFVALQLESSDPNWQGVPIRLITGKGLDQKLTEIRVYFKKSQSAQANLLCLRIQPQEAIELELWVKKPGYDQELQKMQLDFSYERNFDRLPDAYEQVIVDAVRSRTNLFPSSQEVLASWQILQPILDKWQSTPSDLKIYKYGSSIEQIVG